jgi:hypothetical protein
LYPVKYISAKGQTAITAIFTLTVLPVLVLNAVAIPVQVRAKQHGFARNVMHKVGRQLQVHATACMAKGSWQAQKYNRKLIVQARGALLEW